LGIAEVKVTLRSGCLGIANVATVKIREYVKAADDRHETLIELISMLARLLN